MNNNRHKLENYKNAVAAVVELMNELETSFPNPHMTPHGKEYAFRHHANDRNGALLVYLKTVRGISLLNASLLLIEGGHGHEAAILSRIMDESFEDISFVGLADISNPSDKHKKFMKEFFQEEYSDPEDPLSNTLRDRVSWKDKIASFKDHLEARNQNYEIFRKTALSIHRTFSGFVHGPYVFIMELFDPHLRKYLMQGNKRPERIEEHLNNFTNYLYRAVNAVEVTASLAGKIHIAHKTALLNLELAKNTGCLDADGIKALERRIKTLYTDQ